MRIPVLLILFTSLFTSLSTAQTATPQPASPKPPVEVDRALRARIAAFYDLLVNHQYRKAEEFVAPDTRDIYYERDKPRYLGYTLTSISYSDNFTRADVRLSIKMPPSVMAPVPAETPVAGIWQLIDGAWYWSIPKISVTDLLRSGAATPTAQPNAALAPNLALPPGNPNLPGGMGRPESVPPAGIGEGLPPQFSMAPASVVVKPSSTQKVTITNESSAPMTLFVLGQLPGIETSFDHPQIQPRAKAVLSVHAAAGAKDGVLLIGVSETRAVTALPVTVK
jgi:hypothetical protein